ncbi:AGE family epimerase/isomerase, partial [Stenotrophomonas sp. SrG]|uniref:AGE family epimerase/isomerase n=1 Tax=Stenotrophomonas sp. SrG TaxID=3414430 RepID=UPI003CF71E64
SRDYRGPHPHRHRCAAMLAASEARGEARYRARALRLADPRTRRQAAQGEGLGWAPSARDGQLGGPVTLGPPSHRLR